MANPLQAVRDAFSAEASTDPSGSGISPGKIRSRWEASQKAAIRERQNFWINSSFLANEQWVQWDIHAGILVEAPRDGDRLRLTENMLWPSSRTNMAKLLKRPLVFEVAPTAADDESVSGARMATSVLADVHHRHNWEELRRQNAWATWKGGVSVLCVEWDAKAGTPLGVTETGKNFGTGDTVESVLNVVEVATEPGSRDIEHGRWWIKAAALPPKQVQEMYKLPSEPAADASAGTSPLQRKLIAGMGNSAPDVKLTLVLTYFERPGPDNAKGTVAVVVGKSIVEQSAWPFPFTDRLNCVAVRETPHDNDWLGDTILSAAISPQLALNHAVSKISEHMKHAADARLAVPESAGDEWDELSDVPEVVRYTGPNQPNWLSPPTMPEWWITSPDRAKAAIDDILGVHDVSRGSNPGGDSGVALSIQAEQDDTPLGLLAKEMAEAWGRLATLVLRIYEVKVTESRPATVQRTGQAVPEKVQWSGSDLAGQTTATVPLEAVAPRSQAAQMELAFRLKGLYPDLDIKHFARIANLPDADDLTEAMDPDEAKARRENAEMAANGEPIIPADFDDHTTHIAIHNEFRKSARYEALEPQVRQVIDAHVQGHAVDGAREAGAQLAKARVNPALAAAPQANEPPLAGQPGALDAMQQAQNDGAASPPPPGPSPDASADPLGPSGPPAPPGGP
jgi:hypothetical protein